MVLLYVLAGILFAAVTIILLIVRYIYYPRNDRKKKKLAKDYIASKFDDLVSLRAILCIDRNSGILLYSFIPGADDEGFKLKSPEFTSSVLHTFKALGSDMGFKNQNFTRMQFENYSIVSKMGHHCQVVVVSRTEPSTVMEDNLLLFCKGFEKKYFNKFYENKSVIRTDEFIDAIDLVRECFDTFFIESLDLLYDPSFMDEEDVSPLSKIILREAKLQNEKDHTVVLKKLFIHMYGNNIDDIQQKYKKEEILFEIFQLFKHNYFKYYNS
ncbi:MAG: hypothetical protein ACFFCS_15155 [Candidatus Hodarchaeota archaeon]